MQNLNKADLVNRCKNDDPKAWVEFIRRYKKIIYATILFQLKRHHCTGITETAKDVFQEVCIKLSHGGALKRLSNPDAVMKYIKLIAISKSIDAMRAAGTWTHQLLSLENLNADDEVIDACSDIKLTEERRHVIEYVKNQMSLMTEQEKLLSNLVWFHGMKVVQAVRVVDIGLNNAYSFLSRTRTRMRAELKEKGMI
ncbi:MAG: DNA-directed RNA polymerase specialized sigma24 family protein [Candidatus Omnitrophota bacterium]